MIHHKQQTVRPNPALSLQLLNAVLKQPCVNFAEQQHLLQPQVVIRYVDALNSVGLQVREVRALEAVYP